MEAFLWFILFSCLGLQTYIDCRYKLLLDEVNLLLGGAGIIYAHCFGSFLEGLGGMLVLGGSLAGIYYLSKGGLGFGDVKLGMALGAWLGGMGGWLCLLLALLLGGVAGMLGWMLGRVDRKTTLPFGPFLAAAALLVLWKGAWLEGLIYGGGELW